MRGREGGIEEVEAKGWEFPHDLTVSDASAELGEYANYS